MQQAPEKWRAISYYYVSKADGVEGWVKRKEKNMGDLGNSNITINKTSGVTYVCDAYFFFFAYFSLVTEFITSLVIFLLDCSEKYFKINNKDFCGKLFVPVLHC